MENKQTVKKSNPQQQQQNTHHCDEETQVLWSFKGKMTSQITMINS